MASTATKTEQLILYICSKMFNDPSFGAVKLNKVLYYVDHISYLRNGKALSTFSYVKQVNGPIPAELMGVQNALIKAQKLEIQIKELIVGTHKKKPIALVRPEVESFSAQEIQLIDEVIEMTWDYSGKGISDFSHEALAWKVAKIGESLPMFTYLLTEADLCEADYIRAEKFIKRHKEKKAA
ncbi:MAG: SocA family protein [Bacteroidetes bacterium]|nr:SocA family protein [Bacteroidota bacterium]